MLEMPSEGGLASSLPLPMAVAADASVMVLEMGEEEELVGGGGFGGRDSKFESATGESDGDDDGEPAQGFQIGRAHV